MYLYAYVVIVCYISLGIFTYIYYINLSKHPRGIPIIDKSCHRCLKVMRTFLGNKVLFEVSAQFFLGFLEVEKISITASLARKKRLLEEIRRSPVEVGSFYRYA